MRYALLLFISVFLTQSCSRVQNPQEALPGPSPAPEQFPAKTRAYWPTEDWRLADATEGLDSAGAAEVERYLFTRTGDDLDRKGIRTDGVVVVRGGKIVFEKYARGYTQDTPHLIWSAAKSMTSALVGIATAEGKFSLKDPAHKYYPALKDGMKAEITVEHILQMSSGLDWNEGYEASPLDSSVIAMLYTAGRSNMPHFVAGFGLRYRPGTRWYYSSGDTNMLSGILRKTMTEDEYQNYPWTKLFEPIGMKKVTFERDRAGHFVGSSYLYAPPRDLAKFGFLYLNDGMWNGKRIQPEGWVNYTRTLAPAYYGHPEEGEAYGAQFWQNAKTASTPAPWPDAPLDTFVAMGHWGQRIYIIPSLDIVAVRVGDDRYKEHEGGFSDNEFLKKLRAAVK